MRSHTCSTWSLPALRGREIEQGVYGISEIMITHTCTRDAHIEGEFTGIYTCTLYIYIHVGVELSRRDV